MTSVQAAQKTALPGNDFACPICDSGECVDVFEAKAVPRSEDGDSSQEANRDIPRSIIEFARHHEQQKAHWTERMQEYARNNRRVVVWGAGGKGLSFLTQLPTEDAVSYVVDINPRKHGSFVPGSAQQIVSPEFLREYQPETVILMNRLYRKEIEQQVAELGINCEFLIA